MYSQFTTTASTMRSVMRSRRLSRCVVRSRSPRWLEERAQYRPSRYRRREDVGNVEGMNNLPGWHFRKPRRLIGCARYW